MLLVMVFSMAVESKHGHSVWRDRDIFPLLHISDFTLSFRHNATPRSSERPDSLPALPVGLPPPGHTWETAQISAGSNTLYLLGQGVLESLRASPTPTVGSPGYQTSEQLSH